MRTNYAAKGMCKHTVDSSAVPPCAWGRRRPKVLRNIEPPAKCQHGQSLLRQKVLAKVSTQKARALALLNSACQRLPTNATHCRAAGGPADGPGAGAYTL